MKSFCDSSSLTQQSTTKMSIKTSFGRRLRDAFFTPTSDGDRKWECRCGVIRKSGGSGYTNFVQHIQSRHQNEFATFRENDSTGGSSFTQSITTVDTSTFLWSKKCTNIHGWIELVTVCLQPFSICENVSFRSHVRYDPISLNSLMLYLRRLTVCVEKTISTLLPEKFALVFDGWSSIDSHYMGMFATFPSDNKDGFKKLLLAFSPFEDETSQNSDQHIQFCNFVLTLYNKTLDNVVALIGDNCSTNKAFARKADRKFVGCYSHRFNLAVKDVLNESKDELEKVRKIMIKLRTPIAAGKLRHMTPLKAQVSNATRWSSSFVMIKRYREIREWIEKIGDEEIVELLLSKKEDKEIDVIFAKLDDLQSVTIELQRDNISMAEARTVFDTAIGTYPSMNERLKFNAAIVADPTFESAVTKLQDNRHGELNYAEQDAVKDLKADSATQSEEESDATLSIAERALKKRRLDKSCSGKYFDLRFFLPTSNIV